MFSSPFNTVAGPKEQDNGTAEIAIVGGGAIGRCLAAMLSLKGLPVVLYTRSADLEKMAVQEGLFFQAPGEITPQKITHGVKNYLTPDNAAPKHKVVVYACKAPYLPKTVAQTAHLRDDNTKIIFIQGGLQWWFPYGFNHTLASACDPSSMIDAFKLDKIYGGLISFGAEVLKDNIAVVRLNSASPLAIAPAADAAPAAEVQSIIDAFKGLPVPISLAQDARAEMWNKAAGSFAMSAYALITGKTLGEMVADTETLNKTVACANILKQAGEKLGIAPDRDYRAYFQKIAASKPHHRMSIMNDTSEHITLIATPYEIAKMTRVDTAVLAEAVNQSKSAINNLKTRSNIATAPKP